MCIRWLINCKWFCKKRRCYNKIYIQVQLKEIMFEHVEWIELAHDRVRWQAILKMAVSCVWVDEVLWITLLAGSLFATRFESAVHIFQLWVAIVTPAMFVDNLHGAVTSTEVENVNKQVNKKISCFRHLFTTVNNSVKVRVSIRVWPTYRTGFTRISDGN